MAKFRIFVVYWLPALIWMGVIFSASSDRMSFQHSSRIIGPLLHRLFPSMSDHAIHSTVIAVRKCAHLTEYAILAVLFWRALSRPPRDEFRNWRWGQAARALMLVVLYAASDEFHQLFVPSREASIRDVLIDSTGAALGLAIVWSGGRFQKRW